MALVLLNDNNSFKEYIHMLYETSLYIGAPFVEFRFSDNKFNATPPDNKRGDSCASQYWLGREVNV